MANNKTKKDVKEISFFDAVNMLDRKALEDLAAGIKTDKTEEIRKWLTDIVFPAYERSLNDSGKSVGYTVPPLIQK